MCTRLLQIHPTVLSMTFRRAFLSCTENISDLLLAVYLTSVFAHFTNSQFHNNNIILQCRSLFICLRRLRIPHHPYTHTHTHTHTKNFLVLASRYRLGRSLYKQITNVYNTYFHIGLCENDNKIFTLDSDSVGQNGGRTRKIPLCTINLND